MNEAQDRIAGCLKELGGWNDFCNATETWAQEADIEEGLADLGGTFRDAIEVDELTPKQLQKFGIVAILRFNRVVKSYRWRYHFERHVPEVQKHIWNWDGCGIGLKYGWDDREDAANSE